MEERTVERFRKRTIVLHWIHTAAFLILVLTGGTMFLQGAGYGGNFFLKPVHVFAAVVLIAVPLINYFRDTKTTSNFVKETFRFGKEDVQWVLGAPDYYFGGLEGRLPPGGQLNLGQKLWQAIIIVTGIVFLITGIILLVFEHSVPISMFEWTLLAHGLAFVIVFLMFMVHIYLGVFHPRFKESFRSMLDGRVSPSYARAHFPKWYERKSNSG